MPPLRTIRFLVSTWLCWIGPSLAASNPYSSDVAVWGARQILTGAVVSAAASDRHALFLQADGQIVSSGSTIEMTSIPSNAHDAVQVVMNDNLCAALRADGTVVVWGSDTTSLKRLAPPADLGRVKRLSMGYQFLVALQEDSTMRAWGVTPPSVDSMARLERKVTAIAAKPISTSMTSIYFAVAGDTLKSINGYSNRIGVNQSYLGQGIVDIQMGNSATYLLTKNGTVKEFGSSGDTVPSKLGKVLAIAAGAHHAIAIRPDSSVVAWGTTVTSWSDTLLDARRIPVALRKVVAVAAGLETSIAMKADGSIVIWGDTSKHFGAPPKGRTDVVGIEPKSPQPVMRLQDGGAEMWSSYDEVAIPDSLLPATAISTNGTRLLSRRADGTIHSHYIYGYSQYFPTTSVKYVDMATSSYVAYGVTETGTLARLWGDGSSCGGCDLVPLGLGKVKSVEVNTRVAAVIKADGTPYVWGDTATGHLTPPPGVTDLVDLRLSPSSVLALTATGSLVAWGADTSITKIPVDAVEIRAISLSTCALALRKDGRLVSWGRSKNPDCRLPMDPGPVKAISAGYLFNTILLDKATSGTSPGPNRQIPSSLPTGSYPAVLFDVGGAKRWQGAAEWNGTRWIVPVCAKGAMFLHAKTPFGPRTATLAPVR